LWRHLPNEVLRMLTPSATVTLGNLRYDSHASDVVAHLALLPGVNSLNAVLPADVEVSAAAGDPGSLELDGGEGTQMVLTGKVCSLRRNLLATKVSVADGGADLAGFRPCATYEKQNGRDVIRALTEESGVDVGTLDLDLPLAAYVAHQKRTAAEHVAYLARLAGATARVDGDGNLQVNPWPGGQPEAALLYGREVIDYEVRDRPGPQVHRVTVGNGPAGSVDAPDALRHTSSILPGDAPAPGAGAIWEAAPILRTPATALTASQAAEQRAAAGGSRVRARCFLLPSLRPGTVVEVQELPDGVAGGPWMLTQVTHRLRPGLGGTTTFEGVAAGASSGGLGSLLEMAASAVGGLF
jgi:hypothetical protein